MKIAVMNYKPLDLKTVKASEEPRSNDIIVKRYSETVDYDKEGRKIVTPKIETFNLTKKVNETAKLIKSDLADERIKLLEEALEKEE